MAGERREREAAVAYWHQNIFEPASNLAAPLSDDQAKRASAWIALVDQLEPVVNEIEAATSTFADMVRALQPSLLDSDRYKEVLETAKEKLKTVDIRTGGYHLTEIRRTATDALTANGNDDTRDLSAEVIADLSSALRQVRYDVERITMHDYDFRRLDSEAKRRIHTLKLRVRGSDSEPDDKHAEVVVKLTMDDGTDVLEHNIAALKSLPDGEDTPLVATSEIAVVGTVLMERVNRYLEGAADKETGTVTIKKGGSFSAGTLTVTGITNHRDIVEKMMKLASKKEVKFK